MPQIFRIAGYVVYFWANENEPLEPIHVHVSDGVPTANATKIWITQSGKCLLCHNNSKIPMLNSLDVTIFVNKSKSIYKYISRKQAFKLMKLMKNIII